MENEDPYKQMYYEMARAVEKAVRVLVEVQQSEEIYISQDEKKPGNEQG